VITTTNPTEQAAAQTLAELVYEHTGFSEARCLRIARGIIALGDKKDQEDDE
jgi:hypothetical protein